MSSAKSLSHVSFDFWNTLYGSNERFKKKRLELLCTKGNCSSHQVQEAIFKLGKWHNGTLMKNVGLALPAFELNRLLFGWIGIEEQQHMDTYNFILTLFSENPPIRLYHKDVDFWMDKADTKSILSNTTFIPGQSISKRLEMDGLQFDFELYSDEMGLGKPDQRVFHRLREKAVGLCGNLVSTMHIGDDVNHDQSTLTSVESHILT